MNCYMCKYAVDSRNDFHKGEQVRCAKAEELFPELRSPQWVNVRIGVKGQLLKPKCGQYEFIGDSLNDVVVTAPTNQKAQCPMCRGAGRVRIKMMARTVDEQCYTCKGKGEVEHGTS